MQQQQSRRKVNIYEDEKANHTEDTALFPLPLVSHIKSIALRYYGDRDRKREPSSRNDKGMVNTHYYLYLFSTVFNQACWLRRERF
jgi:hypothetical protein